MSDRSLSSSPDILGPRGDADYLISSPAPPNFISRKKVATPYSFKTRKKKTRLDQSSSKNAHTIRFDDILLPSTPPFRTGSRQRSLSPTKVQSETNVSPWRIRVTVEAEHEDENNEKMSPRKRKNPNLGKTMTTKVPLKNEKDTSQTPKKRRGRPRKSDAIYTERNETSPRGSPGRTPKRKLSSPEKRPRGRPMKAASVQDGVNESSGEVENISETIETDDVLENLNHDALNIHYHNNTTRSLSPNQGGNEFNTADSIDEGSNEKPLNDNNGNSLRSHPSTGFNRKFGKRIIEGDSELTPIKSRSAARRVRAVSPENTLYAGHTPRPLRMYPTPTSSSQLDDERTESFTQLSPQEAASSESRQRIQPVTDPTNVHREFDSIMESEGFSMVTLDSLPSVRQQSLSSILSSAKQTLNPLFARTGSQAKKLGFSINQVDSPKYGHYPRADQGPTALDATAEIDHLSGAAATAESISDYNRGKPHKIDSSPQQGRSTSSKSKRNLSLAKLVRVGIMLQSTLRSSNDLGGDQSLGAARKRLEDLFSDFASDVQRELLASLRFSEQMVKRKIEVENSRQLGAQNKGFSRGRDSLLHDSGRLEESDIDEPTEDDINDGRLQISGLEQRQREWQLKREAVSRRIQQADSTQVVVVESELDDADNPPVNNASPLEVEVAPESDQEDEDYDDIWQLEARNPESAPSRMTSEDHEQANWQEEPRSDLSPVLSREAERAQSGDKTETGSPYGWVTRRSDHIPKLGKSTLQQLREEPVNLSPVLRRRDTPNTQRYYADSSPKDDVYRGSPPKQSVKLSATILSGGNNSPSITVQSTPLRRNDFQVQKGLSPPEQGIATEKGEEGNSMEALKNMIGDETDTSGQATVSPNLAVDKRTYVDDHQTGGDNISLSEKSKPGRTNSTSSKTKTSWIRRLTYTFTPGWFANPGQQIEVNQKTDEPAKPSSWRGASKRARDEPESSPKYNQRPRKRSQTHGTLEPERLVKALSISGYFSNDHYIALRRFYRLAKHSPEKFPYRPTPRRNEMIGDYMWTADGLRGVPITEIHFAILDQFTQELQDLDWKRGGHGNIGWTEDDLHKRLFSVIVGEQIRRESKDLLKKYDKKKK